MLTNSSVNQQTRLQTPIQSLNTEQIYQNYVKEQELRKRV
jgi:hypothetical protein